MKHTGVVLERLPEGSSAMIDDFDRCYRVLQSRDGRFDGWFFVGVTSTGIYCRPSCPARTPKPENVRFLPTAAAAQRAGFRACKRCRPDATPGSPEWNARSDVTARAMRLIADGVVDREGVDGLARRVGYSARQLQRLLLAEVGAGPLALARAQRAQTARVLIETTDLGLSHVAFAAGFGSVRQFNDTVREVFGVAPSALRGARRERDASTAAGCVSLRLPYREPFAAEEVFAFLALRAVPGVEDAGRDHYRRALRLPHGAGLVELRPGPGYVTCDVTLDDFRDLTTAVQRCRRLLDLDADPVAVDEMLGADRRLGPWVRKVPGLRVPGTVAGDELAIRAVLGQQVSLASAAAAAARLAREHGEEVDAGDGVARQFPSTERLAALSPDALAMPRARAKTVCALARSLAEGDIVVDAGVDRDELRTQLLALPGVGEWTADYIVLRGTGDPDRFLPSDLGVRHALDALGVSRSEAATVAARWRPWRSYAVVHLWGSLS
jgi:AraC family transcriptional regulator, regulatory protein of adaptative response / DNA-3-methyladenine glycosylase II